MRLRVAGIWLNPRSKNYWFRMAVPERLRKRIGKSEFKYSLETTDPDVARQRHAIKLGEVRALMGRHETEVLTSVVTHAEEIFRKGLAQRIRRNLLSTDDGVTELREAEDNVVNAMLKFLAYRVRCTWGQDHADLAELEIIGELEERHPVNPAALPLAFNEVNEQDEFATQARLLESDPRFQGYANCGIARALLAKRNWVAAEMEVYIIAEAAGEIVRPRTALFDALAELTLRYLADHRFQHWPANIDEIFVPAVQREVVVAIAPLPTHLRRLGDALEIWCTKKGLRADDSNKTLDEWKLAIGRFIKLFGDLPLADIKRPMIMEFRDVLGKLPSKPKKPVATLPLRDQIARAETDGLSTLAPASVKKNLGAIHSLLQIAFKDQEWISKNVASDVEVDGAGYVGDERDRLSDEDMQRIYGSPLMTDPGSCSDTMFWIMFMAPFQGARPGEHCKLWPEDVCFDDGIPIVRIRRRRRKVTGTDAQRRGKVTKSTSSIRDTPLHWILQEAGFLDFVESKKASGAAWLFDDLVPDKYGDRYKELSREINKAIDKLGVSANDKAFYSTRHTMKRETRRKGVSEQNADQLQGHANRNIGRKYGQGSSVEDLKDDIDKLEFRGVEWDAVVACAKMRATRWKPVAV